VTNKTEILFEEETRVLQHYQAASQGSPDMKAMTEKYRDLLEQAKFLTRISDRLENRLQNANAELAEKNLELSTALDELTRARVSRQAYVIIYFIAGLLFVFEELFIDPMISFLGAGIGAVILIKLCIALLLKPAESLLENSLLSKVKMQKRS